MKTIYLFFILCTSFCLTGCGGSTREMKEEDPSGQENTPESVVINFITAIYQGDIEKAKKLDDGSVVRKLTYKWKDMEIINHILQKGNRKMKLSVENVTKESYANFYVKVKIKDFIDIRNWTRVRGEGTITLKVHHISSNDQWIIVDIL